MKIRRKGSDLVLDIVCYTLVALLCLTIVIPFWNLFVTSVTPKSEYTLEFKWYPTVVDWGAWKIILSSKYMWICFKNTVVRTLLGTLISVLITALYAYPLSRDEYQGNKFFTTIIMVTMFFGGGMIPLYLTISDLGLMDTVWSMVLPSALSAFNVIVLKNFFKQLPNGLIEAAKIDGANDIYILFKIVMPLSLPILATITLWQLVSHWNAWFDCLLYIQDRERYVLQIMLRELKESVDAITSGAAGVSASDAPPSESVIASSNLFVIAPIVFSYPFLQKYFVKGLTVGGVKG